ncbi:MAG TPA: universal stress protein [Acidimicrobiales bacterium]|nr:universal stress protein [Acidimicrobiales bacterium]
MDIVAGFIRSAEGRAALDRSIDEARLRGARLVIVHSSKGGSHESEEELIANREELGRISEELTVAGVEHEIREMARGRTPAEDVVSVANETGADLIVIGLRRRSPVGKLVLGSNAQDILLQADCAVLAVKPKPMA